MYRSSSGGTNGLCKSEQIDIKMFRPKYRKAATQLNVRSKEFQMERRRARSVERPPVERQMTAVSQLSHDDPLPSWKPVE